MLLHPQLNWNVCTRTSPPRMCMPAAPWHVAAKRPPFWNSQQQSDVDLALFCDYLQQTFAHGGRRWCTAAGIWAKHEQRNRSHRLLRHIEHVISMSTTEIIKFLRAVTRGSLKSFISHFLSHYTWALFCSLISVQRGTGLLIYLTDICLAHPLITSTPNLDFTHPVCTFAPPGSYSRSRSRIYCCRLFK